MKTFMEHIQRESWSPLENFKLDSNPCQGCGGKCCTGMYLDQGFINPRSKEHMRWAESHDGVEIYLSEDNSRWGVKIPGAKCQHLKDDGQCGIQENKPQGCTDYYGMNPDGPYTECNLVRELIKTGHIACKPEWVEQLWPDEVPPEIKLD